jgi:2',3'-cyclic-nucleotide 2'-phosphodiesterase (5'-nucleotidase family)
MRMARVRTTVAWALAAVLVLLAVPASTQPASLVVLHFNDVYQLAAVDGGKAGGMDRLAGLIRAYQARERCTLVLLAGDLISPSVESSIFKGAQLIEGLNLLGVDAATLGNHEFDYGPAELQKRIAESRFPWVVANAFTTGVRPFPGARMYVIRDVCGTPVGILGLLTPETETASSPGATWFGDPVAVARVLVPIMQRAGARRIIALTHLRVEEDEALLRAVPAIDLAIGGHEHDPLTRTVGGRLGREVAGRHAPAACRRTRGDPHAAHRG